MKQKLTAVILTAVMIMGGAAAVLAHCDTMDGPVVTAAKKAFETGNVNHVLIWVQEDDENTIKHAFEEALEVRKAGGKAKEMAELYFFETLVRIHRAGEGAPYTGLKPAGPADDPVIPAADKAVESGKAADLEKLILDKVKKGLKEKFSVLNTSKKFKADEVKKGREFVKNYVIFIHYAEGIYKAAEIKGAHGSGGCSAHEGSAENGKTGGNHH